MSDRSRDYFDRARAWAATGLFVGAMVTIAGSFLDWVNVRILPRVIPADQAPRAGPFSGFEVNDGWVTLVAGIVMAIAAVFLVVRGRFAWLGFAVAVVSGGIAISDYRGIDQLFVEFQGIGRDPDPGVGLALVAIGSLLGLVSSVAGIAASPRSQ